MERRVEVTCHSERQAGYGDEKSQWNSSRAVGTLLGGRRPAGGPKAMHSGPFAVVVPITS